jgi:Ser-tRNA(Ala) deacylase AlaX
MLTQPILSSANQLFTHPTRLTCTATILSSSPTHVVLSKTPFHPAGDNGIISTSNSTFFVDGIEVDGDVVKHVGSWSSGVVSAPGAFVTASVNGKGVRML